MCFYVNEREYLCHRVGKKLEREREILFLRGVVSFLKQQEFAQTEVYLKQNYFNSSLTIGCFGRPLALSDFLR